MIKICCIFSLFIEFQPIPKDREFGKSSFLLWTNNSNIDMPFNKYGNIMIHWFSRNLMELLITFYVDLVIAT